MNRYFSLLCFCLVISMPLEAQRLKKWIMAADSAYEMKDYRSAFKLYEVALTYDTTSLEVWNRMAISAEQYRSYDSAVYYYTKLVGKDSMLEYPLVNYNLAAIHHLQGDYTKATEFYNTFIDKASAIDSLSDERDKANQQIKNIERLNIQRERFYLLEENSVITKLDSSKYKLINTPRSDYGLFEFDSKKYFTSMRHIYNDDNFKPQRRYAKIYEVDESGLAKPMPDSLFAAGKHIANLRFNDDRSRVYYTVCEYIAEFETRCDIAYRDISANGTWGPENYFQHNTAGKTTTQPSLGFDEARGKEIIFFVSDRSSSPEKQQMDIFYSYIENDNVFSEPLMIEMIDRPASDEISPYFDNRTQSLFFSSDAAYGNEWAYNLGGFDVYRIVKTGNEWQELINLGKEVNSSYNDVFFNISTDRLKAYVSSDRLESLQYDEEFEACCYDIYQVPMVDIPTIINVLTYNGLTGEELLGAEVRRGLDPNINGPVEWRDSMELANSNLFKFRAWDPAFKYLAEGNKKYFYPNDTLIDVAKIYNSGEREVNIDIIMDPIPELKLVMKNKTTGQIINDQLVNLTFKDITNRATEVMMERMSQEEAGDPDSRVYEIALNQTYEARTEEIILPGQPSIVPENTITTFSYDKDQMRALNGERRFVDTLYFVELPPIGSQDTIVSFYFDNARPRRDRDGRAPVIPDTLAYEVFGNILSEYLGRRNTYLGAFANSTKQADRVSSAQTRQFFDDVLDISGQMKRLVNSFVTYLENGRQITLELRGYASPLGNPDFNKKLSKRRIDCVLNYIFKANNGILVPFIESGDLVIKPLAVGEDQADATVIGLLGNRNTAIFNYNSLIERRVDMEILEIRRK
ncbi:MAG: hypothetical protein AAFO07_12040 [Bacteroidota bacterium]